MVESIRQFLQKMLSEKVLRFHFLIFKTFGIWKPEKGSNFYYLWQIISLIVVGIGLPLTLLMAIIFAEDKETALKIPVLMCTILSVTVKCVLIVINRAKFNKLMATLRKMDDCVDIAEEVIMENVFQKIHRMHITFSACYYGTYAIILVEFISKGGTSLFWQSTQTWPWQWAHWPTVYYAVLLLQMITNGINCLVAALTDTIPSILCVILDGHLSVLEFKLRRLRTNEKLSNPTEDVKELIKCVEYHEHCVQ